jgi:hypothetical protein
MLQELAKALHIAVEMEMPKFQKPNLLLLQTRGKGIERKATRQYERFEIRHSLKSIEEIGVGGDVGRIYVPIN